MRMTEVGPEVMPVFIAANIFGGNEQIVAMDMVLMH
jgi:hypothetical protein